MAHDVFISYSSKDKPIADAICTNLEIGGIRCWIAPRDIAPGQDWPTAISTAISTSRVMVLVFSTHSNSSTEVGRELILAANRNLIIIPFKIDNIAPEPGKEYYLARTHWLDAMNPPTQEQIDKLLGYIRSFMAVHAPAIPSKPTPETEVPEKKVEAPASAPQAETSQLNRGWKSKWLWGIPVLIAIVAVSLFATNLFGAKPNNPLPTAAPALLLSPTAVAPTVVAPTVMPTISPAAPTAILTPRATSTLTTPAVINTVGAKVWTGIGPAGRWVKALAIDPKTPTTLYAGTDDGLYKSADGGKNWKKSSQGLTDPIVFALAIDPVTPTTLYAGTGNNITSSKKVGVFKSTDGGENWSASNAGMTSTNIRALAIDPNSPATLYAGGSAVFKSTDGGANWKMVKNNSDIRAMAVNPKSPSILYAASYGEGVYKSTDGGGNWILPGEKNPYVISLVMDSVTPDTLYASTSPVFNSTGGVWKSTNAGENWSGVNTGLTGDVITALAIDPVTPTTLYAAVQFKGVFISTDGAGKWNPDGTNLPGFVVNALAIDPKSPNILYAGPESNAGVYIIRH